MPSTRRSRSRAGSDVRSSSTAAGGDHGGESISDASSSHKRVTRRSSRSSGAGSAAIAPAGITPSPLSHAVPAPLRILPRDTSDAAGHDTPTVSFEEVSAHPRWSFLADNAAIRSGYRYGLTMQQALLSFFSFHNETMNVWTHTAGALTFVVLFLHLLCGGVPQPWASHPSTSITGLDVRALCEARGVSPAAAMHAYNATCCNASDVSGCRVSPGYSCMPCPTPHAAACAAVCVAPVDDAHHLTAAHEQLQHAAARLLAYVQETLSAAAQHEGWPHSALESAADGLKRMTAAASPSPAAVHAAWRDDLLQHARAVAQLAVPPALAGAAADASSALEAAVTAAQALATSLTPAINDGRSITPADVAAGVHLAPVPQWPMAVFMASAVICMAASATFHLLHVVNEDTFSLLARVDYASIAILIAGSSFPQLYYSFYCMPTLLWFYLTLSLLTCGAATLLGLLPQFRSTEWRLFRMSAFIATGAHGVIPMTHMILSSVKQYEDGLSGLLLMGVLYVGGALLYGFRIPERFSPGTFDIVFASHQIFHICVFAACGVHYNNVMSHYEWRVQHAVCDSR